MDNAGDTAAAETGIVDDVSDRGDDLEGLLSEFRSSTETNGDAASHEHTPVQKEGLRGAADAFNLPEPDDQLRRDLEVLNARQDQFNSEVQNHAALRLQQQHEKDLGELVKQVRGDLDADFFHDRLVQAWVDNEARSDPKLVAAYLNRERDPSRFHAATQRLAKEFQKHASKLPDPNATADRHAVTAAMRNGGGYVPDNRPQNLGGMNRHEFNNFVKQTYGYEPGL